MISTTRYAQLWFDRSAWAKDYQGLLQPAYLEAFDIETYRHKKRLLLAPVGHGKSWKAARIEVLHRICFDKDIRVLIVSKSEEQAINDARMVRREIETNARLREDFSLHPADPWSDSAFTITRSRNLKEPTVTASGLYGQIEGLRLDLILCDDLIDWEVTYSEAERRKARDWFDNTLQPRLEPGGEILVIGTRWHPDDLYAHIMAKPGWLCRTYQVYRDGRPLWPEQWPTDKVESERADIGETKFQLKYMNNAIAIEGAAFHREWLHYEDAAPSELRVMVGVDPAVTKRELAKPDPDATALVTIGRSKDGKIHVLDVVVAYIDENHADLIANVLGKYDGAQAVVESNAFQKLIVRDMHSRYPNVPVHAIKHHGTDKVTRIMDLQPRFQSGQILLWRGARNLDRLEAEFLAFPLGSHDDVLDALQMAVRALGGGGPGIARISLRSPRR